MVQAQAELFASVPRADSLRLFEEDGRPRAQRIAEILNYKRPDVSVASGLPVKKVRLEPDRIPRDLAERIAEWGIALNLVADFFHDEQRTILWFRTSNPMLGNVSPRDMIRLGRFKKLLHFIQTALNENGPG